MGEEMTREELEQKIAELESEVASLKEELDKVQEQLGGEDRAEEESEEAGEEEHEIQEDEETVALREKEGELFAQIAEKQMTLVALKKRLNDIVADETMADYGQEG